MSKKEYTNYQRKVIDRYYDNLDGIKLQTLQELVTELYLADTKAKQDRLWERAAKAMEALKMPAKIREHILTTRDVQVLARNVEDLLKIRSK